MNDSFDDNGDRFEPGLTELLDNVESELPEPPEHWSLLDFDDLTGTVPAGLDQL